MGQMNKYTLEIREEREGSPEPALRMKHEFSAPDDDAAIAEAWKKYEGERAPGVALINFALYGPNGLVLEPVREDIQIPRGSRERRVDR
jgi:hypothetical protein